MRNWDASDWLVMIFALIVAATTGYLVFVAIDWVGGTTIYADVSVLEKHYEPGHFMSGTNSRGDFAMQWEGEKYVLIINKGDEVQSRIVSAQVYAKTQPGQTEKLRFCRGWITGTDY